MPTTNRGVKNTVEAFDGILSRLMEPFERETIVPTADRIAARSLRPFLDPVRAKTDAILASREFLDFGGELSAEDQIRAARLARERFPTASLAKAAHEHAVEPGRQVSEFYVAMQAGAVARFGKAWSIYLSERRYLDLSGEYSPGVAAVHPVLSDRDREAASKAIDPLKGHGAVELVEHRITAFLEWIPSVMQFELRQHASIPAIRKRLAMVIDRRIDEAVRSLSTALHETAWEVINKTLSELQENIYFFAKGDD